MTAWRTSVVAAALLFALVSAPAYAKPIKKNHYQESSSSIIGGRPSGCPYRFCGCALSLRIFGAIKPRLNLAANWLGFPRTRPAPQMVAVRRGGGHVLQLESQVQGNTWLVWDPNSGGGKIRLHQRSIAGYVIVDPHASHVAMQ